MVEWVPVFALAPSLAVWLGRVVVIPPELAIERQDFLTTDEGLAQFLAE